MLGLERYYYRKYCESLDEPFRLGIRKAIVSSFGFGLSQSLVYLCQGNKILYPSFAV